MKKIGKASLVLGLVLCSYTFSSSAQADGSGTITISPIRNFGDLTPISYVVTSDDENLKGSSIGRSKSTGTGSASANGYSHAEIINETNYSITLNESPSCDLNASGSSNGYYANASSSISLSGSTASGMCSGPFGSYGLGSGSNVLYKKFWTNGNHTFDPYPNGSMIMTGTWSISVNGG